MVKFQEVEINIVKISHNHKLILDTNGENGVALRYTILIWTNKIASEL